MASRIPELRVRTVGNGEVRASGDFVLYWMVAYRRTTWNFSLQRAIAWATDLNKPLIILEPLRCDYRWASDRIHQFVIQGMADNSRNLADKPAQYYPYLEPTPGQGRGLLAALAARSCLVVTDDFPCFFLPRMVAAAAKQIPVRLELVDGNGLLPMRAADRIFLRAYDFRRFLQKQLVPHLSDLPDSDPWPSDGLPTLPEIPREVTQRWPPTDVQQWAADSAHLAAIPLDHTVTPTITRGGSQAAQEVLSTFLERKLDRYAERRSHPDDPVASGLSPYLHFGHISAHHVFCDTMSLVAWSPDQMADKASGSASGWWGTDASAESFLDELITWRELGYNLCWQRDDYDQYESLPDWAQRTLAKHTNDRREYVYELADFEQARTHDPLWNAAQRELVREGRIHNYLRMLWGKKILEWTDRPETALDIMIELNNKYALDGRNPNSYSGIFWVLGRYDRPWAPERPIFGQIRYMSSQNTARKVRLREYLAEYADRPASASSTRSKTRPLFGRDA